MAGAGTNRARDRRPWWEKDLFDWSGEKKRARETAMTTEQARVTGQQVGPVSERQGAQRGIVFILLLLLTSSLATLFFLRRIDGRLRFQNDLELCLKYQESFDRVLGRSLSSCIMFQKCMRERGHGEVPCE
jgi:hypothetical protein